MNGTRKTGRFRAETVPVVVGFVYFATDEDEIKIGFSGSPEVRLKQIQSRRKKPMRLLGYFPAALESETDVHRRFAAHRLEGEWFRKAPEILDFLEEMTAANGSLLEIQEVRDQLKQWFAGRADVAAFTYLPDQLDQALGSYAEGRPNHPDNLKALARNVMFVGLIAKGVKITPAIANGPISLE